MEPLRSINLLKAAKELNLSIGSIIQYLNSVGHDIDNKPATKLTISQYELLLEKFQKSDNISLTELKEKRISPITLGKINLEELNARQIANKTLRVKINTNKEKDIIRINKDKGDTNSEIPTTNSKSKLNLIGFENFRRFISFDPIEYGPITMLVGKNNSGKSTLVKAILLLKNYLQSDSVRIFNINQSKVEDINIVTYSRAKSRMALANYISFEWRVNNFHIELKITGNDDSTFANVLNLNIHNIKEGFNFQLDPQESQITIELTGTSVDSANGENTLLIKQLESKEKNVKDKQSTIKNKLSEEYIAINEELKHIKNKIKTLKSTIKKDVIDGENFSLSSFYNSDTLKDIFEETLIQINAEYESQYHSIQNGKRPTKEFEHYKAFKDNKFKLEKTISEFNELITSATFTYLGATLSKQSALFAIRDKKNALAQVVNEYKQLGILPGEEAHRFVLKWMNENEFDIGDNFEIKMHAGEAYEVLINSHGTSIPLADKGMGSIQAMLLILRLATIIYKKGKTYKDYTIVIEEPELNLHPALQSKLADLFHEIYIKYGVKLLIETHSEYLIRKTQLLVKMMEYEIAPNENPFTVLYFDKDMSQWKMNYRADGKFIENFGKGFYDESSLLTLNLL